MQPSESFDASEFQPGYPLRDGTVAEKALDVMPKHLLFLTPQKKVAAFGKKLKKNLKCQHGYIFPFGMFRPPFFLLCKVKSKE